MADQDAPTLGDVMPEGLTAGAEPPAEAAPVYERKVDAQGRSYATGKRKNAVARVWIRPGSGRITVNGREGEAYFARPVLQMLLTQPFLVADRDNQYDVWCTVKGGGLSGQAGAVRHGISRALTHAEPALRPIRRIIPNLGGIDISPVILILILYFVRDLIVDNIVQ